MQGASQTGDPTDTGHVYLCIDLKSFYASVECADLGLDPFETDLVVADTSRGSGTICLALSPAIKAKGLSGRPRLFQIPKTIHYRAIRPHMKRYMEVSAQIYSIYLRFIAREDIHVYSIDECFIDATPYLSLYDTDGVGLARMLMDEVYRETRICATAGVGTNLFLAKVALDIQAKHEESHIGVLDGERFRATIWHHRPHHRHLADRPQHRQEARAALWRARPRRNRRHGRGHAAPRVWRGRHAPHGARARNRELRHRPDPVLQATAALHQRGTGAHAPLHGGRGPHRHARDGGRGRARARDKRLACGHVSIWAGYHMTDLDWELAAAHRGPHAAASHKLVAHTSSREALMDEVERLWGEAIDEGRMVKRLGLGFGALIAERDAELTLFTDVEAERSERRLTQATIAVKQRFGKNALVRGRSFREEATGRDRNAQVGGHNA